MDATDKAFATQAALMGIWLVPFSTLALTLGVDSNTDATITFGAPLTLWVIAASIVAYRTRN